MNINIYTARVLRKSYAMNTVRMFFLIPHPLFWVYQHELNKLKNFLHPIQIM